MVAAVLFALVCAGGASALASARSCRAGPLQTHRPHEGLRQGWEDQAVTTTVAVSDRQTFPGNGDTTLAPLALTTGDEVLWTAQAVSGGTTPSS